MFFNTQTITFHYLNIFRASSFYIFVPPSQEVNEYGKQQDPVAKPRPCPSLQEGGALGEPSPDWCSHLFVSADSGRGGRAHTAVGGRWGENYKVISLRFARQLTGQNEARDVINHGNDGRMMIAGSKSKGETRLV